jgi:hypothetical protein
MFLSDAGGGLNLQRAASCCINLELPWNPAVLEQRIGRIYRLGQEQPIDVYNLVTESGIEARIAVLIATKKALFSGLFDGTTDEVCFEGGRTSFLADVEKLVPEVPEPGGEPGEVSADDGAPAELAEIDEPMPIEAAPPMASLPAEPPSIAPDVPGLFASVRVERTAGGGIRLEAPPEAAASLAALFEGMARLLGQATGASGGVSSGTTDGGPTTEVCSPGG